MIRKGVLAPGTPVIGHADGADTTAEIQPDGQLMLSTGDVFRRADDAARAVTGKKTEGMPFWRAMQPDGTQRANPARLGRTKPDRGTSRPAPSPRTTPPESWRPPLTPCPESERDPRRPTAGRRHAHQPDVASASRLATPATPDLDLMWTGGPPWPRVKRMTLSGVWLLVVEKCGVCRRPNRSRSPGLYPDRAAACTSMKSRCNARSCRARIFSPIASSIATTGPTLHRTGGPIASLRRSTSHICVSARNSMRAIRRVTSTTVTARPPAWYASASRSTISGRGNGDAVAKSTSCDGRLVSSCMAMAYPPASTNPRSSPASKAIAPAGGGSRPPSCQAAARPGRRCSQRRVTCEVVALRRRGQSPRSKSGSTYSTMSARWPQLSKMENRVSRCLRSSRSKSVGPDQTSRFGRCTTPLEGPRNSSHDSGILCSSPSNRSGSSLALMARLCLIRPARQALLADAELVTRRRDYFFCKVHGTSDKPRSRPRSAPARPAAWLPQRRRSPTATSPPGCPCAAGAERGAQQRVEGRHHPRRGSPPL